MARRSRQYLYLLPNSLTALGMFLGLWAIMLTVDGGRSQTRDAVIFASWWIVLASMMDGLDGAVARMTKTTSNFGIQFDSLADLVTFGVAPAVILYSQIAVWNARVATGVAAAFAICGALRLARFNLSAGQSTKKKAFQGLPIPIAAGVVVSLILCLDHLRAVFGDEIARRILPSSGLICAYLMISKIRFLPFASIARRERDTALWSTLQVLAFCGLMYWLIAWNERRDLLALLIFGGYTLYGVTAALVWKWKLVLGGDERRVRDER